MATPSSFFESEHDWDQVLIDGPGGRYTRGQILKYYQKHASRMMPWIRQHHALLILGLNENEYVIKRNHSGKQIFIEKEKGKDDSQSFEYWIYRRAIAFHMTIGKTTNRGWVDIDIHADSTPVQKKLFKQSVKMLPKIGKVLKSISPATITNWKSGGTGIHVMAMFQDKLNTDSLRRKLRSALDQMITEDNVVTGRAEIGQIRLDTSTLTNQGSIRCPWSLSTDGYAKVPLKF